MKTYYWIALLALAGLVWGQPPDTLWTYTYASSANDEAHCISPTSDGGFIVGGKGKAPDSTSGALLIKLDGNGQYQWARRYPQMFYPINSVYASNSDGFLITGACSTHFNIAVIRLDDSGVPQWTRCIPSSIYGEPGLSITESVSGDIGILCGDPSLAHPDLFVVCLNAEGDSLWTRHFENPFGYKSGDIVATLDGGFLIGTSENNQALVAKIDVNGGIEWRNTFGNAAADTDEVVNRVSRMQNGDYIIAGAQTRSDWFMYNPFAARLTASGDTLWTREYRNLGPGWFYGVQELSNNQIVFAGSTGESFLLVVCDSDGTIIWNERYGVPAWKRCYAMCLMQNDGVVMAGYKGNAHDLLVVCTNTLLDIDRELLNHPDTFRLLQNYPNPFNASTNISFSLSHASPVSLTIFNVLGQAVYQADLGMLNAGEHRQMFNVRELPSGVYLARVQAGEVSQMRKMVLLK